LPSHTPVPSPFLDEELVASPYRLILAEAAEVAVEVDIALYRDQDQDLDLVVEVWAGVGVGEEDGSVRVVVEDEGIVVDELHLVR
jgi:hypothetical protein